MAAKTKSKKIVTPLKDVEESLNEETVPGKFASPVTGDYVENVPSPEAAQADAQVKDDTDISKKIFEIIEHEYPRTHYGTGGWLQAILCELIRARLSK